MKNRRRKSPIELAVGQPPRFAERSTTPAVPLAGRESKYLRFDVPASKIRGPFAIPIGTNVPTPIDSFPYVDVAGGNLIVQVSSATIGVGITQFLTALITEIEIVGRVQGIDSVLKRTQIRLQTGPCIYTFKTWDLFDTIEVRVRNMTGGLPGGQAITPGSQSITIALQPGIRPALR